MVSSSRAGRIALQTQPLSVITQLYTTQPTMYNRSILAALTEG